MTAHQFKVLVTLAVIMIAIGLYIVLTPTGWVVIGLVGLSAAIYWLGGVLELAVYRAWRR